MNVYEDDSNLDWRLRQEILAEPVDASAVEERVRKAIAVRRPRRILVAASIAGLFLLGTFAFAAWRMSWRAQPSQICSDAARDHLREIVRHEPRPWTSDPARIDALGRRLGLAPAFSGFAVPGYRLDRGKICLLHGNLFLHLVYSNGTREFSLFLAHEAARDGGLYEKEFDGEHIASIDSNQTRAVIVTTESQAAARSLVQSAAQVL